MKAESTFALPKYSLDISPPILPDANGCYPTAMLGFTMFK